MDEAPDAAGMAFAFGVLALITLVIIVVLWQLAATYRARAAVAREEAYRQLAEQTANNQREITSALNEILPKITAIETMLREVD